MGPIRRALSFAVELAVELLADDARASADADGDGAEDDVFYDPNGTSHAHLLDTRGVPMDQDWFDGKN